MEELKKILDGVTPKKAQDPSVSADVQFAIDWELLVKIWKNASCAISDVLFIIQNIPKLVRK